MKKEIVVIYNNNEIIRDLISVSKELPSVMKSYFETLIVKTIKPDEDQVTVWVGDTHLYIAYRAYENNKFELVVINNLDTFVYVIDGHNIYREDIDRRITTVSDFIDDCCIK